MITTKSPMPQWWSYRYCYGLRPCLPWCGTAAKVMRPAANLGKAGASEHAGGENGVDAITSGSNRGSEAGGREETGGGSRVMVEGGGRDEGRGDPKHGVIDMRNLVWLLHVQGHLGLRPHLPLHHHPQIRLHFPLFHQLHCHGCFHLL